MHIVYTCITHVYGVTSLQNIALQSLRFSLISVLQLLSDDVR